MTITHDSDAGRLLLEIQGVQWIGGRGWRKRRTPERDKLKRLGLISSQRPNSHSNMPAVGGHGSFWRTTDAGRALALQLLEAARRADRPDDDVQALMDRDRE